MLSNTQIKFIRSLQQKKYRKLHGCFVAEGDKIVSELLHGPFKIDHICALESWLDLHYQDISEAIPLTVVSPATLSRISGLSTANQVLAVARIPDHITVTDPYTIQGLNLYLDGIQDPGNLGTIIRTADWFGIRQIFSSPGTADFYNPKVIQSSMGSFCRVRMLYDELSAILGKVKNKPFVYGASLSGNNLFETKPSKDAIVVIGNESRGISSAIAHHIDTFISIPGNTEKDYQGSHGAESLNASVAAAIIMAWFSRLSVSG
jgi:RNA methyltransferase, TrmH family